MNKRHKMLAGKLEGISHAQLDRGEDLYLLALDGAPPGAVYFAESGEHTARELAAYISRMLCFKGDVQSLTKDQAIQEFSEFGEPTYSFWPFYSSNGRVKAVRARQELGWKPSARPPLLDDVEHVAHSLT